MKQTDSEFHLKCTFCGKMNLFSKEEIYISTSDKDKLREKFCIHCSEPIIIQCPNCNTTFSLRENLQKNPSFQVADSFWDPIHSDIDTLIPKLDQEVKKYTILAEELKKQDFILRQQEFIEKLPKLKELSTLVFDVIKTITEHPSAEPKAKIGYRLLKEVMKIPEEIEVIQQSLDPETKAVNEKKAKQLKKHVLFLDFIPQLNEYRTSILQIRNSEIHEEKEALKPGYEKIMNHITYDPQHYRILCPSCNEITFFIQKIVYQWDRTKKELKYFKNLPIINNELEKASSSIQVTLATTIHISSDQEATLHGELKLNLQDDQVEIIGRDVIRDIEYSEPESEKILYDEKNPLGRVSNKQFQIEKQGTDIILKGMEYNSRRVGTFLNDRNNDIRANQPTGIIVHGGDKIIIPLINEPNNPNFIEIVIELQ
ncbi:MAG: hypothetical protein ACTSYI_12370 [Promethearchaeota archaeon]